MYIPKYFSRKGSYHWDVTIVVADKEVSDSVHTLAICSLNITLSVEAVAAKCCYLHYQPLQRINQSIKQYIDRGRNSIELFHGSCMHYFWFIISQVKTDTHSETHTYTDTHTHTWIYTHTTYIDTHTHMDIYTHNIHWYTHTWIYTHTHTHTHKDTFTNTHIDV